MRSDTMAVMIPVRGGGGTATTRPRLAEVARFAAPYCDDSVSWSCVASELRQRVDGRRMRGFVIRDGGFVFQNVTQLIHAFHQAVLGERIYRKFHGAAAGGGQC